MHHGFQSFPYNKEYYHCYDWHHNKYHEERWEGGDWYSSRYGVGKLGSGYNVLNYPASILANALVKNHTPIIRQANLAGESFDTIDKPIGDIHSSPNVKST